ncbi:hypothetical protein [Devosia sp. 2618]|uniref:hypothetical protein n=1 Tax=Devosia sp. 2618 TaxID=3156454 RepID=UPI003396866D
MNTSEIPLYVQLVSGIILGVALGNLLSGAARFVQQPHSYKLNWLHGLWIVFILGSIMVFWWEEALSFHNVEWTFWLYMFQVAYCATFLFMTAVLLPDGVKDFGNHYEYLIARRHWFYGSLILSYVLGIGNSLMKEGWDDLLVDPSYVIINAVLLGLLVGAMLFNRRWLHLTVAGIFVALMIATMFFE